MPACPRKERMPLAADLNDDEATMGAISMSDSTLLIIAFSLQLFDKVRARQLRALRVRTVSADGFLSCVHCG